LAKALQCADLIHVEANGGRRKVTPQFTLDALLVKHISMESPSLCGADGYPTRSSPIAKVRIIDLAFGRILRRQLHVSQSAFNVTVRGFSPRPSADRRCGAHVVDVIEAV
jgi:hypothetical protein